MLTLSCSYHTHILLTTVNSTVLLPLPSRSNPESLIDGLKSISWLDNSKRTIAAANMACRLKNKDKFAYSDGSYAVQVTSKSVVLFDMSNYAEKHRLDLEAGKEVVVAHVNASQICLGISGGLLRILNLIGNKVKINANT